MDRNRAWYNLRIVASVILSIATTLTFANYYFDLGFFGDSAKDILVGVGLIGLGYALFLTPKKKEFREHGWWWKEGS